MDTLMVTRIVVITATIILLIWDIYAFVRYKTTDEKNGTISMYIWRLHDRSPLLVFFAGMLIGHFFFPAYDVEFICE
jgi:hypothetical protein